MRPISSKITLAKEEEENKKERRARMKKGGEERKAMISFYVSYFGDVLAEKNKEKEGHLAITFSKFRLVMQSFTVLLFTIKYFL